MADVIGVVSDRLSVVSQQRARGICQRTVTRRTGRRTRGIRIGRPVRRGPGRRVVPVVIRGVGWPGTRRGPGGGDVVLGEIRTAAQHGVPLHCGESEQPGQLAGNCLPCFCGEEWPADCVWMDGFGCALVQFDPIVRMRE